MPLLRNEKLRKSRNVKVPGTNILAASFMDPKSVISLACSDDDKKHIKDLVKGLHYIFSK